MATKKQNKITAITLLTNQIEALNLAGDWKGISDEDTAAIIDLYGQTQFKIVKRFKAQVAAAEKKAGLKALKVAKAAEKKAKVQAKKDAKAAVKAEKVKAKETEAAEKSAAAEAKKAALAVAKAEKIAARALAKKAKEDAKAAPDLATASA